MIISIGISVLRPFVVIEVDSILLKKAKGMHVMCILYLMLYDVFVSGQ